MRRAEAKHVYHCARLEPETEARLLDLEMKLRTIEYPKELEKHEYLLELVDERLRTVANYHKHDAERRAHQMMEIRLAFDSLEQIPEAQKGTLLGVRSAISHLRNLLNDDRRFSFGGYYEIVEIHPEET